MSSGHVADIVDAPPMTQTCRAPNRCYSSASSRWAKPASRAAKTKAPRKPRRSQEINRSELQAATLVGVTSRSLLEFAIGIDRGFIASGISRTRSTCSSPFSRLALLTFT
jgi:hypothetical protein